MVVCMFAAFMVASCSNDELKDNDVSNVQREKCTLSFRVKPFVLDNDVETRSYFDFRQNKICDFYFESDDQFGICALDGSFNAPYPCTSVVEDDDEGDQVITLDAAPLHSMLRNKECIAYYPYNPLHSPDDFKVLFPFNIQKQNENSSDYLANNCNYFVSEPFCFDEYCKGYEIELHPVNSIFDVEVTLPNLENDKYRKFTGSLDTLGKCRFFKDKERGCRFTVIADVYSLVNTLSQYNYVDSSNQNTFTSELANEIISTALANGALTKRELNSTAKKHSISIIL